jgi:uncharacterized membrane protein
MPGEKDFPLRTKMRSQGKPSGGKIPGVFPGGKSNFPRIHPSAGSASMNFFNALNIGAMLTLVVGMMESRGKPQHAHDKRGHGTVQCNCHPNQGSR